MADGRNRKVRLTTKGIDALKPDPRGVYTIWDEDTKHLGLRVTPGGHRSFMVFRRIGKNGKLATRTIGTYPDIGLKDAREQAEEMIRLMRKGIDPEDERRKRQQEGARKKADTVASVVEEFVKRHVANLRTARSVEAMLRRELLGQSRRKGEDGSDEWTNGKDARWRDRPITDITRRDVITLIEGIVDRGTRAQGRKVLANVRKFFNWAVHRDAYGLDVSPVDRIKTADLLDAPKARTRVLDDDELRVVWHAAKGMGYPFGTLTRVLLLTGQRLREIAEAQWGEIKDGTLTVPAERMKGKIAHAVPLTSAVADLLNNVPKFEGFIFTTRGGEVAVSGFSKAKAKLDREVAKLRAKGRGAAKPTAQDDLPPWTIHDLRRTARTRLSTIGVLPHLAEMIIGHKRTGIEAVYDVHRFDAEKRDALIRWERHLLAIVEPSDKNNVTDLKTEKAKRHG
jgi:integrase